jgi:hypothetical protein
MQHSVRPEKHAQVSTEYSLIGVAATGFRDPDDPASDGCQSIEYIEYRGSNGATLFFTVERCRTSEGAECRRDYYLSGYENPHPTKLEQGYLVQYDDPLDINGSGTTQPPILYELIWTYLNEVHSIAGPSSEEILALWKANPNRLW